MQPIVETDPTLRIVAQFFTSATQCASVAMCGWTGGRISLSVDEIQRAPLEEVAAGLEAESEWLTMVVLGVHGGGGQLILTFDDKNGRRLANTLLRRDGGQDDQWSELERSAVMETGNILASAYLSQLTRLTGRNLRPSPPLFIQDFGASVLQQTLLLQAVESDQVLLCKTRFEFDRERVNWNVYFVPGQELLQALHESVAVA